MLSPILQSIGYTSVFAGAFIEGEVVLFTAGALVFHGSLEFSPVAIAAALGSFAGDQFVFFLGRCYGTRVITRFPSLKQKSESIHRLLLSRKKTIAFALRFLYGLRTPGLIALGIGNIPWKTFLLLDLASSSVWAIIMTTLGYFMAKGLNFSFFGNNPAWIIFALSILLLTLISRTLIQKH